MSCSTLLDSVVAVHVDEVRSTRLLGESRKASEHVGENNSSRKRSRMDCTKKKYGSCSKLQVLVRGSIIIIIVVVLMKWEKWPFCCFAPRGKWGNNMI